jgi:uncharacterized alpha-E superfamily protein
MMLSRVADNLYWMRRYIERGAQTARTVGVNLDLAFDRAPGDIERLWGRLLQAVRPGPRWALTDRLESCDAMTDLTSIDAVASCFAAARENARQARQHITGAMWEQLNRLHLALNDPEQRAAWSARPHGFFQTVRECAALFDSAVNAGVARDEGWHFLQLGLFIERADGTGRLLACQTRETRSVAAASNGLDEHLEWVSLLAACDALELYRHRCGTELQPARIIRFLVADPASPRSLRHALDQIAGALGGLAETVPSQPPITVSPEVMASVDSVRLGGVDPIPVAAAVEAECDRVHGMVYDLYINSRRQTPPVRTEAAWTMS